MATKKKPGKDPTKKLQSLIASLESNLQSWQSSTGFHSRVQLKLRSIGGSSAGVHVNNDFIDFELLRQQTANNIASKLEAAKKEFESLT